MIIYPQINNLKIITIPLTVVLFALGYYSITSHNSINEYEHFLEEENKIVATELFDIAFAYHDVEVENEEILRQLNASKEKISRVLDSVQNIKPSTHLLLSYRKQLLLLKEENRQILKLVEELNAENEFLKVQANYVSQELEHSKGKISKFERKNYQLSRKNNGLEEELEDFSILKTKLKDASKLIVSSISIDAIRRIKNGDEIIITKKARRTKKLNVCFTIQENRVAEKGKQEYYIQIIDPKNNVVGDRGSVILNGNSTLIYSKKVALDYNNRAITSCEFLNPSDSEKFEKGNYFVSIFNDSGIVEETFFTLN